MTEKQGWFERYTDSLENKSVHAGPIAGKKYACPCCKFLTLNERGVFDICAVCFWEDDGQDDQDADTARGGPNGSLSLTDARENFRLFGACEMKMKKNVRPPRDNEVPK